MKILSNMGRRCILREDKKVRALLVKEFKRHNLTNKAIVDMAREEGQTFTEATLCRYTKVGNIRNSLTTDAILYLCDKFDIELKLIAKKK